MNYGSFMEPRAEVAFVYDDELQMYNTSEPKLLTLSDFTNPEISIRGAKLDSVEQAADKITFLYTAYAESTFPITILSEVSDDETYNPTGVKTIKRMDGGYTLIWDAPSAAHLYYEIIISKDGDEETEAMIWWIDSIFTSFDLDGLDHSYDTYRIVVYYASSYDCNGELYYREVGAANGTIDWRN